MEHWEASQQGAHCNIIVTQPRRLSAISLAEWVAHERQERVSDKVTYGFEQNKFQFKGYRIVTRQVNLAMMLWICVRKIPIHILAGSYYIFALCCGICITGFCIAPYSHSSQCCT
jgi:hypothetical protein